VSLPRAHRTWKDRPQSRGYEPPPKRGGGHGIRMPWWSPQGRDMPDLAWHGVSGRGVQWPFHLRRPHRVRDRWSDGGKVFDDEGCRAQRREIVKVLHNGGIGQRRSCTEVLDRKGGGSSEGGGGQRSGVVSDPTASCAPSPGMAKDHAPGARAQNIPGGRGVPRRAAPLCPPRPGPMAWRRG